MEDKPKPTSLQKIMQYSAGVPANEQENLNKPLTDPTGVSDEDNAFLRDVISKIESGQIDMFRPDTLINHDIYDKLGEEKKGKADVSAMTLLSNLRNIKDLHDQGHADTYQIQNLVNSCRLMKERVEKECGDCYVI